MFAELDEINAGLMMYVWRRVYWYAVCDFLCMFVLGDDKHDEHMMNIRVSVSRFQ